MEATLHALGRILLNALPTFLILLFLFVYLQQMFFQPLRRTLAARFAASEGAQIGAKESLERASVQVAEYQRALQVARVESYKEQEVAFQQIAAENAARAAEVRKVAETKVDLAKLQMDTDVSEARKSLGAQSVELAERITAVILQGHGA
jgi:F-type H+-transporting ATPase subunit b